MRFKKVLLVGVFLLISFALAGGVSIGLGNQQEIDLEKGLVAYWKFDEGEGDIVFDESGYHNDGVLKCVGEDCLPPKWVEGKIGLALEFDGVDDYVELPNSESIGNFPNNQLTITAWIKVSDFPSDVAAIAGKWFYKIEKDSYLLSVTSDKKLIFAVGNGTARQTGGAKGGTELQANQWYHVVGVYNEGNLSVYVNGSPDGTGTQSGDARVNNGDISFRIGGQSNNTRWFNGTIDEVRIYSRALTDDEIKGLFSRSP